MFKFSSPNDLDLKEYDYQLYSGSTTSSTLIIEGTSSSSVFTIVIPDTFTFPPEITSPVFYGRVRTVDSTGNKGTWSGLVQSIPRLVDSIEVSEISASKIKTGTLEGATINTDGANSVIKSSIYDFNAATPVGWFIRGDGHFSLGGKFGINYDGQTVVIGSQVVVQANLAANSISVGSGSGNILNINNSINSGNGGMTLGDPSFNYWYSNGLFSMGNATKYVRWNGSTLSIKGDIIADSGIFTGTVNASGGTITGRLTAGQVEIGRNVGPGNSGHDGINLNSNIDWFNAWVRRTSNNSFYFRAGSSTRYIQLDSSAGGANAIVFPNFSVDNNGSILSTSGKIGGFNLSSTELSSSTGSYPLGIDQAYTSVRINSNGLIESFYEINGLKVDYYEKVMINRYATGNSFMIYVEGTASGSFSWRGYTSSGIASPSDIRIKNILNEEVDALSILNKVETVPFRYKTDNEKVKRFGFIAQQIYEHIKDAAKPGGDDPEKDPWTTTPEALIPYLVKSIQQLSQKVDELQSRLI